tara:strand:+ start:3335 stop:3628 length:294 start_codon:yes stop_codon:yes gene_type:complete
MKLEAMFDAVIVKPLKEEETMYGNIIVPDLGKDKNEHGEVVNVGPGKYSVTGDHFLKTQVEIGDVVVLPTMGFTKLEHEGEEYFVGPEQQILAKIQK